MLPHSKKYSCAVDAFTNMVCLLKFKIKMAGLEQLNVGHTDISSVQQSNLQHAAQQSITQPLLPPWSQLINYRFNVLTNNPSE